MRTGLGLVYTILILVVWIAVNISALSIPSMINVQFRRAQLFAVSNTAMY
jgi:uncharacterized membrane protein